MNEKIKISAVSYLNTLPFVYGIKNSGFLADLDYQLGLDNPADCAGKLIGGQVDIGLIPVAAIMEIHHPYILTDYCIGADGAVRTVSILSDVPVDEIENLYLDYQSRTSVLLAKILCRKYWKIEPNLIDAFPGYEEKIKGRTAGLVIGDRVFTEDKKHQYVYDLGKAWKDFIGLPFTFALWVANKRLPAEFQANFKRALGFGVENRIKALETYQGNIPKSELVEYFKHRISYTFDSEKDKAFHKYIHLAEPFLKIDKVNG